MKTTKMTKREAHREAIDRFKKTAPIPILDRFSAEQRVQIGRLTRDLALETGASGHVDETIEWLAAAALCVFGLDPLAEEAFCRISRVVFGANEYKEHELSAGSQILEACDQESGAGVTWTQQHRDAERATTLKGRAA